MPPVTLSWYWLVTAVLLGFALLLTTAFHLQVRARQKSVTRSGPDTSLLYDWIASAATLLALVFMIGHSFTRTTYYNAFLLDVLFWPLATTWFIAICLSGVTSGSIMRLDNRWWERWLLLGCCLAFALAGVWWSTVVAQWIIDQVLALHDGPLLDTGVVSAKDSIHSLYSVVISGYKYEAPDAAWWRTLHLGQTIAFVRDPAHTLAFAPGSTALTWLAAGFTICGTLLWVWTLGFMGLQFTSSSRD